MKTNDPSEDIDHPPRIDSSQASRIYLLPNLLTAGNLFFGFLAILRCVQARFNVMLDEELPSSELYTQAVLFILIAMVCDSLDGRVARMGGRESLFGKEFDSIADIISFGMAPAFMVMFLIINPGQSELVKNIGWFVSFIYLLCAGIRLARFNVITHPLVYPTKVDRSSNDFIGLPTPAAAGMIATLVLLINKHDLQQWSIAALPFLLVGISYLMVSPIRYPSFKKVDWNTKVRVRTFILLGIAGAFLYLSREYALVCLFLAYLVYGVFRHLGMMRRIRRSKEKKAQ